jgi:hypothetical protein
MKLVSYFPEVKSKLNIKNWCKKNFSYIGCNFKEKNGINFHNI